ncbi:MAG: hypothetical protein K8R53_16355, partial [Bacteroidales bacterium]|nr:hypothetical protein [Bacteroidales bacterium]
MKKLMLLLSLVVFSLSCLLAQNDPPVAVDDYSSGFVGEYVTVHLTANDYDPDGDYFKIKNAVAAEFYTDSTATYYINPEEYQGFAGILEFAYMLEDEFGNIGNESLATVYLEVINNSFDFLDVNNIKARINAFGNHFWDLPGGIGASYEYPIGSGLHTMFNNTMWIGGMDNNQQLKLAAERYRQWGTDFWTGPLSDDGNVWIDTTESMNWFKVWKLSKEEVAWHKNHWNDPGYEIPENIVTWPAHGDVTLGQSYYLAPFVDVDGDSIYHPEQGDYPLMRADQSIYFIFNDQKLHTETGSEPIGIEVHGMAYAFSAQQEPELKNAIFLSYKIFNRSGIQLDDAFLGLFSDFDIGYAWDDFVGCDIERGAYYGYNGDDYDEDYGEFPPAQGIIVLGGPYMDTDGLDNPTGGCDESINGVGFGDGIIDNERYGMSKFVFFNNTGNIMGDPQMPEEYYNYLQAKWKDGTNMMYGGNGHPEHGAYGPACNFMFPGLSDPCNWGTGGNPPNGPVDWTEEIAGNNPNDRRGLCSMGPFTLEAGGFQKVDIAFITARGNSA